MKDATELMPTQVHFESTNAPMKIKTKFLLKKLVMLMTAKTKYPPLVDIQMSIHIIFIKNLAAILWIVIILVILQMFLLDQAPQEVMVQIAIHLR